MVYESVLLTALLLAGALPFVMLSQETGGSINRPLFRLYLVALTGAYFTWQWRRGGTLAMKTWRLRLVTAGGMPLTWKHATQRYVFALAGMLLLGTGFLWALLDREKLFLHDRLAGTKIMMSDE